MTTDELISFWSDLGSNNVHPSDDPTLLAQSGFETRLIPLPWNGPIRTARAFVAFLNPGLDDMDVPYEAENDDFRRTLRENLKGNSPYVYFDPAYLNHPGAKWARDTFGPDWPSSYADRICILQLVAYHSSGSAAPHGLYKKLQSTANMTNWIKGTLLKRVRSGEALLVIGRGASRFDLEDEPETDNFIRYRNPEFRRAHMTKKTRGGDALRRFLGLPRAG